MLRTRVRNLEEKLAKLDTAVATKLYPEPEPKQTKTEYFVELIVEHRKGFDKVTKEDLEKVATKVFDRQLSEHTHEVMVMPFFWDNKSRPHRPNLNEVTGEVFSTFYRLKEVHDAEKEKLREEKAKRKDDLKALLG